MKFLLLMTSLVSCLYAADDGERLVVAQRYTEADSYYRARLRKDSLDDFARYMIITTFQTKLVDYESYEIEGDAFIETADSAIAFFQNECGNPCGNYNCRFYLGSVLGMKALVETKQGNILGGLGDSHHAASILSDARSSNPSFLPAALGIGVYNYYVGSSLSFIPGNAERESNGLDEIKLAASDTSALGLGSRNVLGWILYDRKQYAQTDSIALVSLKTWHGNTIFQRMHIRALLALKRELECENAARVLAETSFKRNPVNWSDLLSAYQAAALAAMNRGDHNAAAAYCHKGLAYHVPEDSFRIIYVKRHWDYLKNLLAKLNKEHQCAYVKR